MKRYLFCLIMLRASAIAQVVNPPTGGGSGSITSVNGCTGPTCSLAQIGAASAASLAGFATTAFTQYGSSPVITKGATYDGWHADALAAPGATYDGTRYVANASAWSVANSKWATVLYTSSDLKTWSYVTGSLLAPAGSDYCFCNGGVAYFNGVYFATASHYPSGASTTTLTVIKNTSSTLQSSGWATTVSSLAPGLYASDSHPVVNPANGKLEVWYVIVGAPDVVHMQDSSDGTTFTDRGAQFTIPSFDGVSYPGEFHVFYHAGVRYATFDETPSALGARYTYLAYNPDQTTTSWYLLKVANAPNPALPYQNVQVFDGSVIDTDTGDGLGVIPRMLFAGGDNNSGTDNTDSSIGLATGSGFTNAVIYPNLADPLISDIGQGTVSSDQNICWNPLTLSFGVGTCAPTDRLDVRTTVNGGITIENTTGSAAWLHISPAAGTDHYAGSSNAVQTFFTDSAAGDFSLRASSGKAIRLGTAASAASSLVIGATSVSTPAIAVGGGVNTIYICSGGTFDGLLSIGSAKCTGGTGTATQLKIQ